MAPHKYVRSGAELATRTKTLKKGAANTTLYCTHTSTYPVGRRLRCAVHGFGWYLCRAGAGIEHR